MSSVVISPVILNLPPSGKISGCFSHNDVLELSSSSNKNNSFPASSLCSPGIPLRSVLIRIFVHQNQTNFISPFQVSIHHPFERILSIVFMHLFMLLTHLVLHQSLSSMWVKCMDNEHQHKQAAAHSPTRVFCNRQKPYDKFMIERVFRAYAFSVPKKGYTWLA